LIVGVEAVLFVQGMWWLRPANDLVAQSSNASAVCLASRSTIWRMRPLETDKRALLKERQKSLAAVGLRAKQRNRLR